MRTQRSTNHGGMGAPWGGRVVGRCLGHRLFSSFFVLGNLIRAWPVLLAALLLFFCCYLYFTIVFSSSPSWLSSSIDLAITLLSRIKKVAV